MSSTSRFGHHVFISYAHIDDRRLPRETKGWVSTFHEAFEIFLGEWLGEEPRIWRDDRVEGNDYITNTILGKLSGVAVFVSIISPRYVKSEWCLREVQEFWRAAHANVGIKVADKSRLFKVLKLPIKIEPQEFKDQESFEFYQTAYKDMEGYIFYEDKDDKKRTFRLEFGPESSQNYYAKVDDLARDIAVLIKMLDPRSDSSAQTAAADENQAVVYLAETTTDLNVQRDSIKRELLERKYKVLPDKPLPAEADAFKQAVREAIQASQLSIHLIGEEYGEPPAGENRSVVELQNTLAAERDGDPSFSRIIWMPPDLKAKEFRQRVLIKKLLDSNSTGITELLQNTIEDLKTVVQDKINAPAPSAPQSPKARGSHLVYVICDRRDAEKGEALRQLLSSQGYEVALPTVEADEATAREEHNTYLKLCNSVLIYWGNAPAFWPRLKLQDLQRIFGEGRAEPFALKAIYAGSPRTNEKDNFLTHEAMYIKSVEEEITLRSLSPFLGAISEEAEGEIA